MSDTPRRLQYEAAGPHDSTGYGTEGGAPPWAHITAGIAAVVVGLAVPAGMMVLAGVACGVFQSEGWFAVDTHAVAMFLAPVAILCGFLAGRATARWIMSTSRMSKTTP